MSAGDFLKNAWNKTTVEANAAVEAVGDAVVKSAENAVELANVAAAAGARAESAASAAVVAGEAKVVSVAETVVDAAKTEGSHLASKASSYAKTAIVITAGVFEGQSPVQVVTTILKAAVVVVQLPQLSAALVAQKILRYAGQHFAPNSAATAIAKCTQPPAVKLASVINVEKALIVKAGPPAQQSNAVKKAVSDAQANIDAGVRALMSDDAYSNTPPAPPQITPGVNIPGFQRLNQKDLEEMGLNPASFDDPDLHAALYKSNDGTVPVHYTLAFRGTDNQTDVITDIRQGMSIDTAAYKKAQYLGAQVLDEVTERGGTMDVTGHSLGGGLAQAVSASTGVPGTTFNAAGLDPNSVATYNEATLNRDMVNYHVAGEPLTETQELLAGIPAAAGQSIETPAPPDTALLDLHKMPAVETSQAIRNLQTASVLQHLVGPP